MLIYPQDIINLSFVLVMGLSCDSVCAQVYVVCIVIALSNASLSSQGLPEHSSSLLPVGSLYDFASFGVDFAPQFVFEQIEAACGITWNKRVLVCI